MDEYLPPLTLKWCQDYLQRLKFDPSQPASDPTAPHRTIYLQLRTAVSEHLMNDEEPELRLSEKPTGALGWQPVQTENVRRVELIGDDAEIDVEDEI